VLVAVGSGEGVEVGSVVEDGSGAAVSVGSGDGEGEVTAGFTTVTKFPLEVPDDVAGKCSNKSEGKEWGRSESIHYRPQIKAMETMEPRAAMPVPTTARARFGAGRVKERESDIS
jgi:hypothetical protein